MRPDTITIDSEEHAEVTATAATLTVAIEGSSVFLGDEALRKAREVSALVSALAGLEVPREQIHVTDVQVGSEGFLGLKSSSCRYLLCIREVATDRVAPCVSAIAAQKGAQLVSVRWLFGGLEVRIAELRRQCLLASREIAGTTAAALGLKIAGVYRHSEELARPDQRETLGGRRRERLPGNAAYPAAAPNGPALSFVGKLSLATQTQYRVVPVE